MVGSLEVAALCKGCLYCNIRQPVPIANPCRLLYCLYYIIPTTAAAALAHVLAPLQPWMTAPRVLMCPDGHYRRAVFEIGPFIADYPKQVYVSGVVQGWCPK